MTKKKKHPCLWVQQTESEVRNLPTITQYKKLPFPKIPYHDKSGANFSERIAILRDNSSRIAKSEALRY